MTLINRTLNQIVENDRTGLCTTLDSDGLIKWIPHNRLEYSDDLTQSTWVKSGVVSSISDQIGPYNTSSGVCEIVETNASVLHGVWLHPPASSSAPVNVEMTFTLWAKRNVGARNIYIRTLEQGLNSAFASIDLSNGNVLGSSGDEMISTTTEDAGNGWYKITGKWTYPTNMGGIEFGFIPDQNHIERPVYQGDGSSSILIWGLHWYRSDLGGMQNVYPDERDSSAAASYLRTDENARYLGRVRDFQYQAGVLRGPYALIEPQTTNEITESREINNWRLTNALVTPNATISPSGQNDADLIIANTTDSSHSASFDIAVSEDTYVFSCFFKPGGYNVVRLVAFDGIINHHGYFDLTTDETSFTSFVRYGSIEDYGNGWKRCWILYDGLSGSGIMTIRPSIRTANGGFSESFPGDNVSGVYAWGAQLERLTVPSSYVPTEASQSTRTADIFTIPWMPANSSMGMINGSEFFVNGNFSNNELGNWVEAVDTGGSTSISNGQISLINDTGNSRIFYNTGETSGKIYLLSWDQYTEDGPSVFDKNQNVLVSRANTNLGRNEHIFVAPYPEIGTASGISFRNSEANTVNTIGNISLVELNNNIPWPKVLELGPELISDTDFSDTNLTDWEAGHDAGGSSFVNGSGQLVLRNDTGIARLHYTGHTDVPGETYLLSFDQISSGGPVVFNAGGKIFDLDEGDEGGRVKVIYTAPANTQPGRISFSLRNFSGGTDRILDNISLKRILNPTSFGISIAMTGQVTFYDNNKNPEVMFLDWKGDSENQLVLKISTSSANSRIEILNEFHDDPVLLSYNFDGGQNIPFSLAARTTTESTNVSVNGESNTQVSVNGLPDLSESNILIGSQSEDRDFILRLDSFRLWSDDIGNSGILEASVNPDFIASGNTGLNTSGYWIDTISWSY